MKPIPILASVLDDVVSPSEVIIFVSIVIFVLASWIILMSIPAFFNLFLSEICSSCFSIALLRFRPTC